MTKESPYTQLTLLSNTAGYDAFSHVSESQIIEKARDILSDRISGHHAQFRSFELAFALNRLRGFEVIQQPK